MKERERWSELSSMQTVHEEEEEEGEGESSSGVSEASERQVLLCFSS